jgi:hypothetical protein
MNSGDQRRPPTSGQPLGGVVGVLNIDAWNGTAKSKLLLFALLEAGECAAQEVEVGVAHRGSAQGTVGAELTIEGVGAVGLIADYFVEVNADVFAAHHDLVCCPLIQVRSSATLSSSTLKKPFEQVPQ